MRIQLGDLPLKSTDQLASEGWIRITGLGSRSAILFTWLLGIFLLFALLTPIILFSLSKGHTPDPPAQTNQGSPWLAVILTALLAIPAHELVHAACLPDHGLSQSTILAIWPRKLRFGIFFEGTLSRSRWLAMRFAPFILLAVIPALWLMITPASAVNFTFEICMDMLILVNSLGAGADLLAAVWVLFHIPPGSTLMFAGGRAFWRVNQNV